MAYFIYTLRLDEQKNVRELRRLKQFDSFKEAKIEVRKLRAELGETENILAKIIFAESAQEAEARLLERRAAPILKEWEK